MTRNRGLSMELMAPNSSPLSFGRYLKSVRLERGIRLQQISSRTRIGVDILLAIEREDHARLPAEVFVKGFIRAYAETVGADADQATRLYLASRRIFQERLVAQADVMRLGLNFWPRLLIWLTVLFAFMALTIQATSFFQQKRVARKKRPETLTKKETPAVSGLPDRIDAADTSAPAIARNKLLLEIRAVEKTGLKVVIDERKAREYSLNPGDRLELEALSQFNLLIDNAAGVRLRLNDKDLTVPGKEGQFVTLKLP